ncbi:lipooligosaccharide transport system permease protein [Allocatelliglobosispora scoriae]|uniref:Transport permease protein n=1 Tax=Allocatelliglobosispora scoriae TaxID=643052 RepID=A0A841BMC0_9ACTN|nr:ABC transporter permease [Allocatelliglobosispora scoriae]MBB5868339.1 lipooligosaccharide transport system permease protein [Allocatelliglobosispora scoriae]
MTQPIAYAAGPWASVRRALAVSARNVAAASHPSYLWVLLSGLFEPAFYLFSIGLGVGSLVGSITVDGEAVSYVRFVAPAMLAASVMNGAMSEATFNFFTKLRMMRLHDATACTPVSSTEMVLGEVLWSVARGAVHSIPFLVLMQLMGLIDAAQIPGLFVVTLLTGFAFGALGAAISTFLRGTHDFDRVNLFTFVMFVFSGTFAPVSEYPLFLGPLAQATPLWQAVALTRDLSTGTFGWDSALHCGYLVVLAVLAMAVASRRMERTLRG